MGNRKKRLERLEGPQERGAPIIIVRGGETDDEAWQKHLAQHPEDDRAEAAIFIKLANQDPPITKAETKDSTEAPGPTSRTIMR